MTTIRLCRTYGGYKRSFYLSAISSIVIVCFGFHCLVSDALFARFSGRLNRRGLFCCLLMIVSVSLGGLDDLRFRNL